MTRGWLQEARDRTAEAMEVLRRVVEGRYGEGREERWRVRAEDLRGDGDEGENDGKLSASRGSTGTKDKSEESDEGKLGQDEPGMDEAGVAVKRKSKEDGEVGLEETSRDSGEIKREDEIGDAKVKVEWAEQ